MISSLVTKEYWTTSMLQLWPTSMLQLWPTSTFLSEVKQYEASANAFVDYERGAVHYRSIWVTFCKYGMRLDFDGVARVYLPFTLPVHEMSRILQNKMYVMAHKKNCFR